MDQIKWFYSVWTKCRFAMRATYLSDKTGPTSLKISFNFSSVASYGIFPTEKLWICIEYNVYYVCMMFCYGSVHHRTWWANALKCDWNGTYRKPTSSIYPWYFGHYSYHPFCCFYIPLFHSSKTKQIEKRLYVASAWAVMTSSVNAIGLRNVKLHCEHTFFIVPFRSEFPIGMPLISSNNEMLLFWWFFFPRKKH